MAFGPLVTPEWLIDNVGHRDLVIVDCRWALGAPEAGRRAWEGAHIPTAHFIDVERDLSRPQKPGEGRHPLPDARHFAAAAAGAGIGAESIVVAYDEAAEGGASSDPPDQAAPSPRAKDWAAASPPRVKA